MGCRFVLHSRPWPGHEEHVSCSPQTQSGAPKDAAIRMHINHINHINHIKAA